MKKVFVFMAISLIIISPSIRITAFDETSIDRSLLTSTKTILDMGIKQARKDYYLIYIPDPNNPGYYKPNNPAQFFQVNQIIPPFVFFTHIPRIWDSTRGDYVLSSNTTISTIAVKMNGSKVFREQWIEAATNCNIFGVLGIIKTTSIDGFPMNIPAFFPLRSKEDVKRYKDEIKRWDAMANEHN